MAIAASATKCARLFESLLQLPPSDDLKQNWESVVFRFNIWCENNYILHPRRASMDWRLRDAPLIESAMVEVLDELKRDLIRERLRANCSTCALTPVLEHTTFSVSENRILFPPSDIRYSLNRLWRLSRAIRRTDALHGVPGFADCIEYDENGVNLTEEFKEFAKAAVESRLDSSMASEDLKKRIFDTICLRQQHFAYLRLINQTKQPTSHPNDYLASTVPGSRSDMASLKAPRSSSSRTIPATKSPRGSESDIPSMATTSTEPERGKHVHSLKPASGNDDDKSSRIVDKLPPPPNTASHFIESWCPYCFSLHPPMEFSGKRWK